MVVFFPLGSIWYRHQREGPAAKFTDIHFRIAGSKSEISRARFFQFEGDHPGILDWSFTGRAVDGEPPGKYQFAKLFERVIPYEVQIGEQFFGRSDLADDRKIEDLLVDIVEAQHALF